MRHSTEACATMSLSQTEKECLKSVLENVNGWSSPTAQWKRVPESWCRDRETTSDNVDYLGPVGLLVHNVVELVPGSNENITSLITSPVLQTRPPPFIVIHCILLINFKFCYHSPIIIPFQALSNTSLGLTPSTTQSVHLRP